MRYKYVLEFEVSNKTRATIIEGEINNILFNFSDNYTFSTSKTTVDNLISTTITNVINKGDKNEN